MAIVNPPRQLSPALIKSAVADLLEAQYHARMAAVVIEWSAVSADSVDRKLLMLMNEKLDTVSTLIEPIAALLVGVQHHLERDVNANETT